MSLKQNRIYGLAHDNFTWIRRLTATVRCGQCAIGSRLVAFLRGSPRPVAAGVAGTGSQPYLDSQGLAALVTWVRDVVNSSHPAGKGEGAVRKRSVR